MSTIENINNNISNKPRFFKILIHSVIWIFLLCMPILLSTNTEFVVWNIVERWWVSIFLYAIVFYINYLSMVDKLFFGKKKILFFGANILILFALACVSLSLRIVFFNWRAAPHHMEFIYRVFSEPKKQFQRCHQIIVTLPKVYREEKKKSKQQPG